MDWNYEFHIMERLCGIIQQLKKLKTTIIFIQNGIQILLFDKENHWQGRFHCCLKKDPSLMASISIRNRFCST